MVVQSHKNSYIVHDSLLLKIRDLKPNGCCSTHGSNELSSPSVPVRKVVKCDQEIKSGFFTVNFCPSPLASRIDKDGVTCPQVGHDRAGQLASGASRSSTTRTTYTLPETSRLFFVFLSQTAASLYKLARAMPPCGFP